MTPEQQQAQQALLEHRKRICEPILSHVQQSCDGPDEEITVLMMCVTELTARAIQTKDSELIADRINNMVRAWTTAMSEAPEAPPKPEVPH